jgi:hypothetical protein
VSGIRGTMKLRISHACFIIVPIHAREVTVPFTLIFRNLYRYSGKSSSKNWDRNWFLETWRSTKQCTWHHRNSYRSFFRWRKREGEKKKRKSKKQRLTTEIIKAVERLGRNRASGF